MIEPHINDDLLRLQASEAKIAKLEHMLATLREAHQRETDFLLAKLDIWRSRSVKPASQLIKQKEIL